MNVAFFHGLESPAVSDKTEYLDSAFTEVYAPAMDYNNGGHPHSKILLGRPKV